MTGTAWCCRPFNRSSQTPSAKAMSRCERQGEKDIQLQMITLMYASVITFWDHEEKMECKVFQTAHWSGLCLSSFCSQQGMKIFLNLNPAFTVWGHTLSHGKAKCPVIFYTCLLLWTFFLRTVPLFQLGEIKAEKSGMADGTLGSLWMWNSWMKVTWFVDDPHGVKHVCTERSSNNSE